ncbi:uncharacterized protein LOC125492727 [Beta vulgaris subsp. vulgaris]|uniref:uncharacterized protein LOC125492727 n=1 Tax=Beta vulgaris subsp. vulgaris TaxID=3555 RepID=UPI002549BAFC|nr:uncharacterized protein LOC125492727 [Beta vulgaris subsp. vulgaris]
MSERWRKVIATYMQNVMISQPTQPPTHPPTGLYPSPSAEPSPLHVQIPTQPPTQSPTGTYSLFPSPSHVQPPTQPLVGLYHFFPSPFAMPSPTQPTQPPVPSFIQPFAVLSPTQPTQPPIPSFVPPFAVPSPTQPTQPPIPSFVPPSASPCAGTSPGPSPGPSPEVAASQPTQLRTPLSGFSDTHSPQLKNKEAENFVDPFYRKDVCLAAYAGSIPPLEGERHWPRVPCEVQPPPIKIGPSRPRKNRRRDLEEDLKKHGTLKRTGSEMTCSLCKVKGHNKRRRPNRDTITVPEPAPKKPRGRPMKDGQPPQATYQPTTNSTHHNATAQPSQLGRGGKMVRSGVGSRGCGRRGRGRGRVPVGVRVFIGDDGSPILNPQSQRGALDKFIIKEPHIHVDNQNIEKLNDEILENEVTNENVDMENQNVDSENRGDVAIENDNLDN